MIKIVIPCYNEAQRIQVDEYLSFLSDSTADLVFVNDGSTDNTLEVLMQIRQSFPYRISILDQPVNTGKAAAVRNGILSVLDGDSQSIIGFMDADLATPLCEVANFLRLFDEQKIEFVFGSRVSVVNRKYLRSLSSRLLALFVKTYFKIPICDSQCGAKFFGFELAGVVFSKPFITRWLFDIEIFKRIHSSGKKLEDCAIELPLDVWTEKGDSKLGWLDMMRLPFELYKIARYY